MHCQGDPAFCLVFVFVCVCACKAGVWKQTRVWEIRILMRARKSHLKQVKEQKWSFSHSLFIFHIIRVRSSVICWVCLSRTVGKERPIKPHKSKEAFTLWLYAVTDCGDTDKWQQIRFRVLSVNWPSVRQKWTTNKNLWSHMLTRSDAVAFDYELNTLWITVTVWVPYCLYMIKMDYTIIDTIQKTKKCQLYLLWLSFDFQ